MADDVQPDFGIPWVPIPPASELATWPQEKPAEYLAFRQQREQDALNNPVGARWIVPSWQEVLDRGDGKLPAGGWFDPRARGPTPVDGRD